MDSLCSPSNGALVHAHQSWDGAERGTGHLVGAEGGVLLVAPPPGRRQVRVGLEVCHRVDRGQGDAAALGLDEQVQFGVLRGELLGPGVDGCGGFVAYDHVVEDLVEYALVVALLADPDGHGPPVRWLQHQHGDEAVGGRRKIPNGLVTGRRLPARGRGT